MRRSTDRLIRQALRQANHYRIKPTTKGYALWRFKDWTCKNSGWSILARYQTRQDAEQDLLERLDLEPPKPKPTYVTATITYVADDYGFGWG